MQQSNGNLVRLTEVELEIFMFLMSGHYKSGILVFQAISIEGHSDLIEVLKKFLNLKSTFKFTIKIPLMAADWGSSFINSVSS